MAVAVVVVDGTAAARSADGLQMFYDFYFFYFRVPICVLILKGDFSYASVKVKGILSFTGWGCQNLRVWSNHRSFTTLIGSDLLCLIQVNGGISRTRLLLLLFVVG